MGRIGLVVFGLIGSCFAIICFLGSGTESIANGGFPADSNRSLVQESDDSLVSQFDTNKDQRLSGEELDKLIANLKQNPRQQRGPGGRGGPGGPPRSSAQPTPGRRVAKQEGVSHPDKDLFDQSVMRTYFIDFDRESWESDMALLKDHSIDIPATVTVDGKEYPDVGIRFRGNSSFFSVGDGLKRSLNLSFDWADGDQRLMGQKTINLLNSHSDPSYLRLVMYSRIARDFVAAPKACFTHVVINGESWGVYVNEQQFNKDFTDENFGTRGGRRFKSPPGRNGASFVYQGDDPSAYWGYEIKSKDEPEAWSDLITCIKKLDETPADKVPEMMDEMLSIDRVLWFLAVDNVLLDMDGYYSRGADYLIYQDPIYSRFHILPYDNNETFRAQGGGHGPGGPGGRGGSMFGLFPGFGGPPPQERGQRGGDMRGSRGDRGPESERGRGGRGGRGDQRRGGLFGGRGGGPGGPGGGGPGGPGGGGPGGGGPQNFHTAEGPPFALDIFAGISEARTPLASKLLSNPELKSRYTAHVRTIRDRWMNWKKVEPILESYRSLIDSELKQDGRSLSTYAAFKDGLGTSTQSGPNSAPGFKAFFDGRIDYLTNVDELNSDYPRLATSSEGFTSNGDGEVTLNFRATFKQENVQPEEVYVYVADNKIAPYKRHRLNQNDGEFTLDIPGMKTGSKTYWYMEARTGDRFKTTCFYPAEAEANPSVIFATPGVYANPPVVISEVMASNKSTIKDTKGEFDDWIELYNTSDKAVDLSEMYLTDSDEKLTKWKFPKGTKIASKQCLVVWADEDKKQKGLHANFKLSKSGEHLMLTTMQDGSIKIVDQLKLPELKTDQSFGKNGKIDSPSPGKPND